MFPQGKDGYAPVAPPLPNPPAIGLPVSLKRTYSVISTGSLELSSKEMPPALGDSDDFEAEPDICMTPVADSPFRRASREDRFSLAPPSPPCKRVAQRLKHRVSWSDLFRADSDQHPCITPKNSGDGSGFGDSLRMNMSMAPPPLRAQPSLRCSVSGSRFMEEFENCKLIGTGNFSAVYRAKHKLDGQQYAIKKTKGSVKVCQSEAQILAGLSACMSPYIVRYYNSWIEDGRLHLQTELCESSLPHMLKGKDPQCFEEAELVELLQHVSRGLHVMHTQNMVHLDIKPDNILRGKGLYKIADLGLAQIAITSASTEITEGDCRYLARELLKQDFRDLPRADIFSFGIMCYELAVGRPLPTQGDEWHWLRDGMSSDAVPIESLADLIVAMIDPTVAHRPDCEQILTHEKLLEGEARKMEEITKRNSALARELATVTRKLFEKENPRALLQRHFSC